MLLEVSHGPGAHGCCSGENDRGSTSALEGGAAELEGAAKGDVEIADGAGKEEALSASKMDKEEQEMET